MMTYDEVIKAMRRDAKDIKRRLLELDRQIDDNRRRTPEGKPACSNCGKEVHANRLTCSKACLQARLAAKKAQPHTVTDRK